MRPGRPLQVEMLESRIAPSGDSTTTLLSASAPALDAGASLTLTALVTDTAPSPSNPAGTVTFFDGPTTLPGVTSSTPIGANQLQIRLTTTNLTSTGSHVLGAAYNGDTKTSTSTSAVLLESVNQPLTISFAMAEGSAAAAMGAGAPVTLKGFSPTSNTFSGNNVSINSSTSGGTVPALVVAAPGSSTNQFEGYIRLSEDGRYLTLAGPSIDANNGHGADASVAPRTIARVDASGHVDMTTQDPHLSGLETNGAVSTDGTQFWDWAYSGAGTAVNATSLGKTTPSTGLQNTYSSFVGLGIAQGQLYGTALHPQIGDPESIVAIGSGTPTTPGQTTILLPGNNDTFHNPGTDFVFLKQNSAITAPGPDTLYVADQNSSQGLVKYTFDGTSWNLVYKTIGNLSGQGIRDLVVIPGDNGSATIYALSADMTTLIMGVDPGIGGEPTFTTVATTNTVTQGTWNGLALSPYAVANATVTTVSADRPIATAGQTVTLTADVSAYTISSTPGSSTGDDVVFTVIRGGVAYPSNAVHVTASSTMGTGFASAAVNATNFPTLPGGALQSGDQIVATFRPDAAGPFAAFGPSSSPVFTESIVGTATKTLLAPISTTTTEAVSATGSQTVAVSSITLTNLTQTNTPFIVVGSTLSVDSGANNEIVTVTATNPAANTFTAVFSKTHAPGVTVMLLNQLSPLGIVNGYKATVTVTSGSVAPTGTVTFLENGAPFAAATLGGASGSSATAFATIQIPATGTYTITAVYSGSTSMAVSTSIGVNQEVATGNTTIALTTVSLPTTNPLETGSLPIASSGTTPIVLNATVNAANSSVGHVPSGMLQFLDNGSPLGSPITLSATGTASLTVPSAGIPAFSAGTHPITASYTSSNTSPFNNTTQLSAAAPTITVVANGSSIALKSSINTTSDFTSGLSTPLTLTTTVSPAGATGTVDFFDGNIKLNSSPVPVNGSGMATLTLASGLASVAGTVPGAQYFGAIYVPTAGNSYSYALTTTPILDPNTGAPPSTTINPIASGDTIVTQAGDGFTNNSALAQIYGLTASFFTTDAFLDEVNPVTHAIVQRIGLPDEDITSGAAPIHALTLENNDSLEGDLQVSSDNNGRYVTIAGMDEPPFSNAASAPAPVQFRTVARLDLTTGALDTSTQLGGGANSAVNTDYEVRDAMEASVNNQEVIYVTGGAGSDAQSNAIYYVPFGTQQMDQAVLIKSGAPSSIDAINIFNGQLYVDTPLGAQVFDDLSPTGTLYSGGLPGPNLPVSDELPVPGLSPGGSGGSGISDSPNQFVFFATGSQGANPDLLYLADATNGLLKFSYNGTQWIEEGSFNTGLTSPQALTGYVDPVSGAFVLYATSAISGGATELVRIVDGTSRTTSITATPPMLTVVSTTGVNLFYRGLALDALPVYKVAVVGSSTVQAGTGFLVTVQAADAFGNPIYNYTGPASVTASVTPASAAGNFPASVTIGSTGLGLFLGNLPKVGSYTISVASGSLVGSAGSVTVTPGPAAKLAFATQPVSTPTGLTLPAVTVQVQDLFGNVVTKDNNDTVTLSIASGPASFAAGSTTSATVTNGVATFNNLSLIKPGTYTLGATVSGLYTGPHSAAFTVLPLQVVPGSFVGTSSGFSVSFNTPFLVNSTTPIEYGTGFGLASGQSGQPPTVILTTDSNLNDSAEYIAGTIVPNTQTNSLQFIATNTTIANNTFSANSPNPTPTLPDGTYYAVIRGTNSVSPNGIPYNGLQALNAGGGFLDGTNTGLPGHDFIATFTISNTANHDDVVWVPATADGPLQPLTAPGNNQQTLFKGGLPVYLDDTTGGVTSVTGTFTYNPTMLMVTGGSANSALSGSTFTVTVTTPGTATFTYMDVGGVNKAKLMGGIGSSNALIPGGSISAPALGFINATVPNSSAATPIYHGKDVLTISNVQIDGGATQSAGSSAVHLVAYVGDADGNGSYSSNDAVLITRVLVSTDSGFVAYPLVDPVIVADTSGSGFIPSNAALQANSAGVGFPTANLASPPLPPGANVTPIGNNVDPTLSVGHGMWSVGRDGSLAVTVPVNLDDAYPAGSTGLIRAGLALTYDPRVFTVSAADIHLGSLLAGGGWNLVPTVDQTTGQIAIALSAPGAPRPISAPVGGSLVTIDFYLVVGRLSKPSTIALVASATPDGQPITTELQDAQGTYTLTFAATASVLALDGSSRIDGAAVPSGMSVSTSSGSTPALAAAPPDEGRTMPSAVPDATSPAAHEGDDVEPTRGPAALAPSESVHESAAVVHAASAAASSLSSITAASFTGLVFEVANGVTSAAANAAAGWQRGTDAFFQALGRAAPNSGDPGLAGMALVVERALTGQLFLSLPDLESVDGLNWENIGTDLSWPAAATPSVASNARDCQAASRPTSPDGATANDRSALDQVFAQAADDETPGEDD